MQLYEFIEVIDECDLTHSKIVLNKDHPTTGFYPLQLLQKDLSGDLSPTEYAATLAWNGNRPQMFKVGEIIVQLIQTAPQRYVLGSVATVLSAKEVPGPNRYLYTLEKHTGNIADFYGVLTVDSTYVCNMSYQLLFSKNKEKFLISQKGEVNKFPGYSHINLTFRSLESVIDLTSWKTALQNQKGVYLLRDNSTGKMYVGSAYGKNMLWQRWKDYLKTGHGGDKSLIPLGRDYIRKNFSFVILETFNSNTKDEEIIRAESAWKEKLGTRLFGYNNN